MKQLPVHSFDLPACLALVRGGVFLGIGGEWGWCNKDINATRCGYTDVGVHLTKMIRKLKYGITELKNSTDQELVELIYDKACELYFGTFGESLDKADKALSDFLVIWTLDSEVKNGGFDQFFLNNGLEYGKEAVNGFTRIGAKNFATLTEKAIEIFKKQDSEFENKRNPDFDNLDDEYYDFESWENLQIEYIRKNYEKFVVE